MICLACGKEHDILEALNPECLSVVNVATEEEIIEALEKGRKERELWEQSQPGFYK